MFTELKKMRGTFNNCATTVEGKNTPEGIADKFKETYNDLYNRTGTREPMNDLLNDVNKNIGEEHLDDVNKVTPELISTIIKEKIKNGKTDPEFDLTTDCFKQAPIELSEHLSNFLKSCLIHGYMSQSLLLCAIIPLVKDVNGKLDDSNNYRGIGLSCLLLKIFDWII